MPADRNLALSVARHWAMFVREIGSTGRKIDGRAAVPGNLLLPPGGAEEALAEDYASILTLLDEDEPFGTLMRRRALIEKMADAHAYAAG